MLKKGSTLKWIVEAKQSFEAIKESLTKTPVLISPNFNRYFINFSFTSEHTIAASCCRRMMRVINNLSLSSVKL